MRTFTLIGAALLAAQLHGATEISGDYRIAADPGNEGRPLLITGDANITLAAGLTVYIGYVTNTGHTVTWTLEKGASVQVSKFVTLGGGKTTVNFAGGALTDAGGWSTPWFVTDAASETELVSVEGSDILITHPNAQIKYLAQGEGKFATSGAGRLVIRAAYLHNGTYLFCDFCKAVGTNLLHTGGTLLGSVNGHNPGVIYTTQSDQLPRGRIEIGDAGWNWGARLDLCGTSQHVDQLVLRSNYGYITNTGLVTGGLFFTNENAVIDCPVEGTVTVRKTNPETTLTVKRGPISYLDVDEGTALVKPEAAGGEVVFGRLDLAAGATLEVDGAAVVVTNYANAGGTVVTRNGGTLTVVLPADEKTVRLGGAWGAGATRAIKTGAGELYYAGHAALEVGKVHVAEGLLKFTGPVGTTNAWWRFTAMQSAAAGGPLSIGPMRLLDENLDFADGGSGYQGYNGEVSDFGPKNFQCTSWDVASGKSGSDTLLGPDAIWLSGSVLDCTFKSPKPSLADPSTWITWTYRIANTTQTICGYNLKTQWGVFSNWPRSWTLESSVDGITWEMMDARTNYTDLVQGQKWYHGGGYGVGGNEGHPATMISFDALTPSLPTKGGLPASVNAQVDAGATLDCSLVAAGQAVGGLTVDMTKGGGTLRGVALAAEGTFALVNVPGGKVHTGDAVTLAFENVTGLENISNWAVTIDGRPSQRRIRWNGTTLYVDAAGFGILVR